MLSLVPYIETMSHIFTASNHCRTDTNQSLARVQWLWRKQGGLSSQAVIDVNQTAHSWVKCITCHRRQDYFYRRVQRTDRELDIAISQWSWPLTFEHRNLISSSFSLSEHSCQVWRNPLKRMVHPKMKILSLSSHPQVNGDQFSNVKKTTGKKLKCLHTAHLA